MDTEGRCALPLVLDRPVPDFYPTTKNAHKCILNAKRKLTISGKFNDYCNFSQNCLPLDIIEKAPTEKLKGINFLPHRAVIKENSTTSIKRVFNASFHLPDFL